MAVQESQTVESKYEETKEILQAVVSMYADNNDQDLVRGAGKSLCQLQKLADGERNNETVNIIRELAGQARRGHQQLAERQASALMPAQRDELEGECGRVEQSIVRLNQENNSVREQITAAERQALEIGAREQHVRQQEGVEVPRARHMISLYANISSIRWDYSSNLVKGFITSADGNGIRSFDLNKKEHTSFSIANTLWDLMDA